MINNKRKILVIVCVFASMCAFLFSLRLPDNFQWIPQRSVNLSRMFVQENTGVFSKPTDVSSMPLTVLDGFNGSYDAADAISTANRKLSTAPITSATVSHKSSPVLKTSIFKTLSVVNTPPTFLKKSSRVIHTLSSVSSTEHSGSDVCDDVLTGMMQGRWRPRNVTSQEVLEVEQFHKQVRKEIGFPENLQRADRRCGTNVRFPGLNGWIRALCDEKGDTPCCFRNLCVNRTREQCTCPECLDTRLPQHAELADWTTENPSCQPREMSVDIICLMLSGFRLSLVGDSLVRHIYTAMLMLITGDAQTGALRKDTPPDMRKSCSGMYMFTEKVCRGWLERKPVLCNGSVHVQYFAYYKIIYGTTLRKFIGSSENVSQSVTFFNLGIHDNFNASGIQTEVLLPLLKMRASRNATKPKLVWLTTHCPGLLKNGNGVQGKESVQKFNDVTVRLMRAWGVPVMDTFSLTENVVSFDGQHFGWGVNRVKALAILNYVSSLRSTV